MRKNFAEVLKSKGVDYTKEYNRIVFRFCEDRIFQNGYHFLPCRVAVNLHFGELDKRIVKRCIDLNDFNEEYGYDLSEKKKASLDDLISISEYFVNFMRAVMPYCCCDNEAFWREIDIVDSCMSDVGCKRAEIDGVFIYTEDNPAVNSVAEISSSQVALSLLEYNHFRLKGDLDRKKAILRVLAEDIELKKKELSSINKVLTDDFFQLLQKFVRHDNSNNEFISNMSRDELEETYDDIYQMYLLAKLELDHNSERKKRVEEIIKRINS